MIHSSSEPTAKIGVIGVGYLGRFHAQKYAAAENCQLVGVYDASADRAQEVAKEVNSKAFGDIGGLLSQVDAVSVAAPTRFHFEIAKQVLNSGKHLLLEKPMTLKTDESAELVRLARDKSKILQVGHVEQFNPVFVDILAQAPAVQFVEARRMAPFKVRGVDADVVLDLMIHDIDLILTLIDSPVVEVRAAGTRFVTHGWDAVQAWLGFANGARAALAASRVAPVAERKMRIATAGLHWDMDLGTNRYTQSRSLGVWQGGDAPIDESVKEFQKVDALKLEIENFLACIHGKASPRTTGEMAQKSMVVAERIVEAAAQKA